MDIFYFICFCFFQLIKTYKEKMENLERSTAQKLAEARQRGEEAESPAFQDFTTSKFMAGRKKRHLPIAPRKRASTEGDEGKEWP